MNSKDAAFDDEEALRHKIFDPKQKTLVESLAPIFEKLGLKISAAEDKYAIEFEALDHNADPDSVIPTRTELVKFIKARNIGCECQTLIGTATFFLEFPKQPKEETSTPEYFIKLARPYYNLRTIIDSADHVTAASIGIGFKIGFGDPEHIAELTREVTSLLLSDATQRCHYFWRLHNKIKNYPELGYAIIDACMQVMTKHRDDESIAGAKLSVDEKVELVSQVYKSSQNKSVLAPLIKEPYVAAKYLEAHPDTKTARYIFDLVMSNKNRWHAFTDSKAALAKAAVRFLDDDQRMQLATLFWQSKDAEKALKGSSHLTNMLEKPLRVIEKRFHAFCIRQAYLRGDNPSLQDFRPESRVSKTSAAVELKLTQMSLL